MKTYIPTSLNIDRLLAEHPPMFEKFCKDHLMYILGLINLIPSTNKDLKLRNDFVPINSRYLQRIVPNYKKYLDYLLANGVLLTDNWYLKGEKSKGYKFTQKYSNDLLCEVKLNSSSLRKRIAKHSKIPLSQKIKYQHLLKWYTGDLSIDWQSAFEYIMSDYHAKTNKFKFHVWKSSKHTKSPLRQFSSAHVSIEKIRNGDFSLSIDDNVHRLHSTLSNMRSDLRQFLSFSNSCLASVDIANCQPYLSLLLLKSSFWSSKEVFNVLTVVKSYKEIFNNISLYDSFVMLCKRAESLTDSDVHRFQELVLKGQLYDYMATVIGTKLGFEINNRKRIKELMFQVLFTDNRFIGQEDAAPKREFRKLFPTVYQLFSLIKQHEKANLPKLLQRIESHLVLQIITKRISKERSNLPIFTLHDSIITTIGNELYVKTVMQEELTKVAGYAPALKVEYWTKENRCERRA
jgi:hypothetical protein